MEPLYLLIYRNHNYAPGKYETLIHGTPKAQRKATAKLKANGFQVKAWKINIPDYPELVSPKQAGRKGGTRHEKAPCHGG